MGDLDGDGRSDVCVRAPDGIQCARSTGDGFAPAFAGPALSDANGWAAVHYWSTIRLADFDGDGKDDLCARSSLDLSCWPSTGAGFGERVRVAPLSDATAWADRARYATLRVGDVDGDGAADLCARGDGGMRCWRWDAASAAFGEVGGPAWSDAAGWSGDAAYYQTIRTADFDGDGMDDLPRERSRPPIFPTECDRGSRAAVGSAGASRRPRRRAILGSWSGDFGGRWRPGWRAERPWRAPPSSRPARSRASGSRAARPIPPTARPTSRPTRGSGWLTRRRGASARRPRSARWMARRSRPRPPGSAPRSSCGRWRRSRPVGATRWSMTCRCRAGSRRASTPSRPASPRRR